MPFGPGTIAIDVRLYIRKCRAWRDLDRSQINEETDAVVEFERESYFEYPYRIISEKSVRALDTGQLMGGPIFPIYRTSIYFFRAPKTGPALGNSTAMNLTNLRNCLATAICLLLIGCATATARVGLPEDFKGGTAIVRESGGANLVGFLTDGEAHTFIQSVDGSQRAADYAVLPGPHDFKMSMTHMGTTFVGIATIDVPAVEKYVIVGRRRGTNFEVALVRENGESAGVTTIAANRREPPLYIPLVGAK